MKTVAHILKRKLNQAPVTISALASAREAAQVMAAKKVGVLLVGTPERIVGIVSERDLARKVLPFERPAGEVVVGEIMSAPVLFVDIGQSIEDCMRLMSEHRLRHLPVRDQGRLVGMVSIGDVVNDLISDQRFTIEQLEHYIADVPAGLAMPH